MLGMWIRRSGYGQIRGKWVDQKYQNLCLATFFTRFGLSMDRFNCFMPKSGFFQKSGCFSLRRTRMHSLFILLGLSAQSSEVQVKSTIILVFVHSVI